MASTSGCVPGTTLTVTNAKWQCDRPLSSYGTLPIKVVVNYTRTTSENGAVDLINGCVGDSNPNTIDLILDVQGDGRTVGNTVDAIKLRLGPRDIQITGRAQCGPRSAAAHADGIQNQGSTNITFVDFEIGHYDAGLATCQGAGGIAFWTGSPQMHFVRGKFVGCNHALNATQASTASSTTGSMWRSGRTDGSDPVCAGINPSPPCTSLNNIGNSGVVCEQWRSGRWQTQG